MHPYRTHTCAALTTADVGNNVRLSGWVHRVRDHGGLLFIDLRDHYGLTQLVIDPDSAAFAAAETVRSEWVIRVDGEVKARTPETVNPKHADRRHRSLHPRARSAGRGQGTAAAGVRRAGLSRGHPPHATASSICAARRCTPTSSSAPRSSLDAPPHGRHRLCRIFDADPDRFVARRRARLPRAVAASIPASSSPCRRRRSSTSSC